MADATAPVLSLRMHPMPLLAHMEELRKRIIFSVLGVLAGFLSCWSFADRIFGLMQQPIINALRHHGLGGGLVYLNPTEPFNLYLEVALVAGLFTASPFVFYQLWLFIAPGLYRTEKRYVLPFLLGTGGLFIAGGLFRLQNGLPGIARLSDRIRATLPADDHDWGIHEAFRDNHSRSWADFRNASSSFLSGFDAGYNGALDVAESAVCDIGHLYYCGHRHAYRRHPQHVPVRHSDGCALRHQYRSGLAREFQAPAENALIEGGPTVAASFVLFTDSFHEERSCGIRE